jgi:CTP:molybdopterin cytidylyltransferase MocA
MEFPKQQSGFSSKTSIAILAGGLSRRMGKDKSFTQMGAKTIFEHVLTQVRQLKLPTILITNTPDKRSRQLTVSNQAHEAIVGAGSCYNHDPISGTMSSFHINIYRFSIQCWINAQQNASPPRHAHAKHLSGT